MQYRGSASGIQLEAEPLKPAFQGWSLGTRKETIGSSLGMRNQKGDNRLQPWNEKPERRQ
jgi:hypothetical protein